jgi:hypothetical protein
MQWFLEHEKPVRTLIVFGLLLGALLLALLIRWWQTPRIYPYGNRLGDSVDRGPFLTDNVCAGYLYVIWHNNRRQEFVVLQTGPGNWFRIGVYPPDDNRIGRERRFAFTGWTEAICNHHFIERDHVASSLSGDAHYDQYLRRLARVEVS